MSLGVRMSDLLHEGLRASHGPRHRRGMKDGRETLESVGLPSLGRSLRSEFSLAPDITHLNHGGYGAVPKVVQAAQERWRAVMEENPTRFFMSILPDAIRAAAIPVAHFLGTKPERLAFLENATTGLAAVARSLRLEPGDEVLACDHVYNAARLMFRHVCEAAGARFVEVHAGMPVTSDDQIIESFRRGIGPRTRLILVDHIASSTAVIQPLAEIIALGRAHGVPVLVDGAHGPGLVDLDIDALGADIYIANLHKWLMAPRGAAVIVVREDLGFDLHPPAISHAYGQGFTQEFDKIGTRDSTPWLVAPEAIAYHQRLGGAKIRQRNAELARAEGRRLAAALGTETGAHDDLLAAMAIVRLPIAGPTTRERGMAIMRHLSDAHRIVVAIMAHSDAFWVRVSTPAYVEPADIDRLIEALPDTIATTKTI